eukprot:3441792-Amphidinium_carterae.2
MSFAAMISLPCHDVIYPCSTGIADPLHGLAAHHCHMASLGLDCPLRLWTAITMIPNDSHSRQVGTYRA